MIFNFKTYREKIKIENKTNIICHNILHIPIPYCQSTNGRPTKLCNLFGTFWKAHLYLYLDHLDVLVPRRRMCKYSSSWNKSPLLKQLQVQRSELSELIIILGPRQFSSLKRILNIYLNLTFNF